MASTPPGPAPVANALRGRCPRCAQGKLFRTFIVFRPKCSACDLDYRAFNVGDGAATFLILIVGAIVTGLAMWLELTRSPAWYVHVALWVPLTIVLTVILMRVAKALLIALEYRHEARLGHL
ncbi:membrane protein [Polymorphobacter glacialis]|uniref:Membrane protein n=1 Tax=Sandarakinorhabdus glacialis TaxID=1614636 RepID=A0A916ZVK6_9SPHN|nr:DUF983 domain-containing protein [Polymorphobacter glacialis]GGE16074.1 membrane protein [Polymorphobacter glacialis]